MISGKVRMSELMRIAPTPSFGITPSMDFSAYIPPLFMVGRRADVAAAAKGAAAFRQLEEGILQRIDAILHRYDFGDLGVRQNQCHCG